MAIKEGPGRYALFGHPVSHSWSPFIHDLFARQFDHVVDYRLCDVDPAAFRRAVIDFFVEGGGGANVTLPHKPAAAEIVNELSARAERARAVNTIIRRSHTELLGDNTDGAGLVTDLVGNLGVTISGSRLLVLGAGGAVRGVPGLYVADASLLPTGLDRYPTLTVLALALGVADGIIEAAGSGDL